MVSGVLEVEGSHLDVVRVGCMRVAVNVQLHHVDQSWAEDRFHHEERDS